MPPKCVAQNSHPQGLRFNVHTLFTHLVLTPLPGGVYMYKHLAQKVFIQCEHLRSGGVHTPVLTLNLGVFTLILAF